MDVTPAWTLDDTSNKPNKTAVNDVRISLPPSCHGLLPATEDTNAYHGGVGAEVFIGEHVAIGAEYLMVVPGIRSIQHNVVSNALEATLGDGDSPSLTQTSDLNAGDFVSPSNFQATLGLRYYF